MSYSKEVEKYFQNRDHVGSLDANDPDVGTMLVGNPKCGDVMKLQVKVSKDGVISDIKYKTFGCGAAIACSAYAAEQARGKTVNDAKKDVTRDAIVSHLSLPPVKIHCSCLAAEALEGALKDYERKQATRFFSVTDDVFNYLSAIGQLFCISTQSRGCAGISYSLNPAETVEPGCHALSKNGVTIFITREAEMHMIGTEVDYESRADWEGLIFKNPNEVGRCKCGESVYIQGVDGNATGPTDLASGDCVAGAGGNDSEFAIIGGDSNSPTTNALELAGIHKS